ncbi:uncharacterized protein ARMOST_14930 [Armillaria ostoyae]|uniref:Uncharacterized protein n=1 Tax=Armillaria ostoyae TaxID=47428 RepID=A0A284RRY8_ARMOS|nr:uncharacterized protein ARMOST_14930 [Armillaria ostoyae]
MPGHRFHSWVRTVCVTGKELSLRLARALYAFYVKSVYPKFRDMHAARSETPPNLIVI